MGGGDGVAAAKQNKEVRFKIYTFLYQACLQVYLTKALINHCCYFLKAGISLDVNQI